MYYFAYGSNMSHKQMQQRCPNSLFITASSLKDYKFVYDGYSENRKGAVANIIKSPGSVVLGGIYEITQVDLQELDKYEGYRDTYNRREMKVENDAGMIYTAIVYYRTGKKQAKPSAKYRQRVIDGANDCSINKDYIEKVLNA